MSTITTVEQAWQDTNGQPRLEIRTTETFDDGSFTVSVANEAPPGAVLMSRSEYDAAVAQAASQRDTSRSEAAFLASQQASDRSVLKATITPKLINLGFTEAEAEALFP
jgi:hypothetical protein